MALCKLYYCNLFWYIMHWYIFRTIYVNLDFRDVMITYDSESFRRKTVFNNHTSFSWWCWKGTLCSAVWLNHFCRIMRIGSWSIEARYYLIFCNKFFNVLQIFPIPSNYPRCLHEYFRIIYFWDEVVLP